MNANQAAAQQIVSGVNEARFLEHMRTLFSTSTTVLAECLQNGRRAGASQIDFDYDVASSTLTITDNGCGVADFRTLITVAESGWSEEMMASEKPFGIGFFSVSFAAETIVVESRGKKISFSSEDLIAKRQIAVESSSFIGGTRISLIGCKLGLEKICNALGDYARGFPTPVFWMGKELERPHAQANLKGVDTGVGFVHVASIHGDATPHYSDGGYVYCQGLPVAVGGFTNYRRRKGDQVIHVDHLMYTPRMPDRDSLIDSGKAAEDFEETLKGLWREHVSAKKTEMPAAEFVDAYWKIASSIGFLEVMSDVPVLPKHLVFHIGETPYLLRDGDSFWCQVKEHVTLDKVVSGEVTLCEDFDEADRGNDFAKLMFAEQAGLLFLSGKLPESHWANAYLRNIEEEEVMVSGTVVAEGNFSGDFVDGTVKLVDRLSVTLGGKTLPINDPFVLGEYRRTFMVPLYLAKRGGSAGYVVRQASSYLDEHDSFCETDFDNDSDSFDNLVAILAGEPGTETIAKCLKSAGAKRKTNLLGKSFLVQFDEKGELTVTEA